MTKAECHLYLASYIYIQYFLPIYIVLCHYLYHLHLHNNMTVDIATKKNTLMITSFIENEESVGRQNTRLDLLIFML